MDAKKLEEFNQEILNAFKINVEKSKKIISGLEQDVKVKEVELNFLAKKYDEEFTKLNKIMESSKEQIQELKNGISEQEKELSKKENEIKLLNNELSELKKEFASTKEENKEFISQVETLKDENDLKDKNIGELKPQLADITNSLSLKEEELQSLQKLVEEKEKIIEEQKIKFKPLELDLEGKKRLRCPSCGAVGKDIKEEEDKSQILGYSGHSPIYAKIRLCKKCGTLIQEHLVENEET
jgi:chromosome segregation ATPase